MSFFASHYSIALPKNCIHDLFIILLNFFIIIGCVLGTRRVLASMPWLGVSTLRL
jgi:hypothetical protein